MGGRHDMPRPLLPVVTEAPHAAKQTAT